MGDQKVSKGVILIHNSKKDRQHKFDNGQKEKDGKKNNGQNNITHKTEDRGKRTWCELKCSGKNDKFLVQ